MIGEATTSEPIAPVVGGPRHALVGILPIERALEPVGPAEGDVTPLALGERVARPRPVALDPDPQIRRQT